MDVRALVIATLASISALACDRPAEQSEAPLAAGAAAAVDADPDHDGVLGPEDQCPEQRGLEPDGCPIPDRDHDGVLDPEDACPDEPECPNGYADADGCPDGLPGELEAVFGVIEGLAFEIDKSEITRESYAALDALAEVLLRYPDIVWEISGHLDSRGSDFVRRGKPSQKRADSVRDYLIHEGVDPQKLIAVGYGEDKPIASNRTAEGRALNRRIEINPRDEDGLRARATCAEPSPEVAAP